MKEATHNFNLIKTFYYCSHPIYFYVHNNSGLRVIIEKNNNQNRKFQISFKTPPKNNKGSNHVLEHLIMNGSDKYPLLDMLWRLNHIAYATFINAITYPTYTCYSASSRDEGELLSVARVYMDAISNPLFLKDKQIFAKEAVRYELDDKSNIVATGTVFNEMQESSHELWSEFAAKIFPDTQDRNYFGGIPENIMELTYDEVYKAYYDFYVPSNTLINVTGNVKSQEFLKLLNGDNFKNFHDRKCGSAIKYFHQHPTNIKKYDTLSFFRDAPCKEAANASVTYILHPELFKKYSNAIKIFISALNNPAFNYFKKAKEMGYINVKTSLITKWYNPIIKLDFYANDLMLISEENLNKAMCSLICENKICQSHIDKILKDYNFNNALSKTTDELDEFIEPNDFMMSFVRFDDPWKINYYIDKKNIIHDQLAVNENDITAMVSEVFNTKNQVMTIFEATNDIKLGNKYRINEKLQKLKNEGHFKKCVNLDFIDFKNHNKNKEEFENLFKDSANIDVSKFSVGLIEDNILDKPLYISTENINNYIAYKLIFKIDYLNKEDIVYWDILDNAFSSYVNEDIGKEEISVSSSVKVHKDTKEKTNAFL